MGTQFFAIPATEILDRLIQSYQDKIVKLRQQNLQDELVKLRQQNLQDEIVKLRQQNAELESENEELREVINQIGR